MDVVEQIIQLPTTISTTESMVLIVLSCFTSMMTAAIGIGGGSLLIAVMAQIVPIKALIPVHGAVQLGSNVGRSAVMFVDVRWRFIAVFSVGALIGAAIGGQVVVSLPENILRLVLGSFILYSVWLMPKARYGNASIVQFVGGLLTTVLTMFVGAAGPLVIALVRNALNKPIAIVATSSVCLVIQHTLKLAVFGALGFAFNDYIGLIIAMIITGFIGTLIGKRILLKTKPDYFKTMLSLVLTFLALRLIYQGTGW